MHFFKESHPFKFLSPVWLDSAAQLSVSLYSYIPDTAMDVRSIISLNRGISAETHITSLINRLGPAEELSLHSKVLIDGSEWHIPMLDLACNVLLPENIARVYRFFPKEVIENGQWFYSGRSYHFYSTFLLSPAEWISFLGCALLLNKPGHEPISDSRWIGHRLMAGYGALRQSCNTEHYLQMPELVKLQTG